MEQSNFKFIEQKEDGLHMLKGHEALVVQTEIAYQLKRIADALESRVV